MYTCTCTSGTIEKQTGSQELSKSRIRLLLSCLIFHKLGATFRIKTRKTKYSLLLDCLYVNPVLPHCIQQCSCKWDRMAIRRQTAHAEMLSLVELQFPTLALLSVPANNYPSLKGSINLCSNSDTSHFHARNQKKSYSKQKWV